MPAATSPRISATSPSLAAVLAFLAADVALSPPAVRFLGWTTKQQSKGVRLTVRRTHTKKKKRDNSHLCGLDRLFQIKTLDIQGNFEHLYLIHCGFVALLVRLQAIILCFVPLGFVLVEGDRLQVAVELLQPCQSGAEDQTMRQRSTM